MPTSFPVFHVYDDERGRAISPEWVSPLDLKLAKRIVLHLADDRYVEIAFVREIKRVVIDEATLRDAIDNDDVHPALRPFVEEALRRMQA